MATHEQIGRKRLVVGAHYGSFDFLVQRMTAIILAVYSVLFLICALFTSINYESWKGFFTFTCFGLPLGQISATLAFFSLAWHAWIGVRDIWMDYVKPTGLRLTLHVVTIAALVGYTAWAAAILWRL